MTSRRFLFVAALAWLLVCSFGCAESRLRPARPLVMQPSVDGAVGMMHYTVAELNSHREQYDAALSGQPMNVTKATFWRDRMISRVRADIRWHSGEFDEKLRERMAEWETFADFGELGLALATTITGGESTKTVLGAVMTAVKGGRISVDKNYFREKGSEAIISMLRANRIEKDALIVRKMSSMNASKYTFEEAWNDLVDLYYAGTLTSAFQRLADQAGAKAEQAAGEMKEAEENRVRAAVFNLSDRDQRTMIVNWLLARDLVGESDEQKRNERSRRIAGAINWIKGSKAAALAVSETTDPRLFVEKATREQLDAFIADVIESQGF